MTVGELIEALSKYPADLSVMVDGYEGGCHDLLADEVGSLEVCLNHNGGQSSSGPHEPVDYELRCMAGHEGRPLERVVWAVGIGGAYLKPAFAPLEATAKAS